VLRALAGEAPGLERRELIRAVVVLALGLGAGDAMAQAPRPEDLYAAGAFRAAADSFAARVAREPTVAEYWYNLGAAFYRLGEDGRAKAAWIRAARLAPRDDEVRRALALLPGDPVGSAMLPVARWRPGERLLLGALLWCAGWFLVAFRRGRRVGIAVLVSAAVLGGAGWRLEQRYREPAAIVLRDEVPLRSAPYGSAAAVRWLAAGDAVRVRRRAGAFLLVDRAGGLGWVEVGEVARL
jgi:tetratricopeptide (TPR) repeat protein